MKTHISKKLAITALIFACFSLFINAKELDLPNMTIDDNYAFGNKDLKGIVLDNSDIKIVDNKPIMLVFGQDGCYYCRLLVKSMKNYDKIRQYLKDNFSAYYINTSDSKRHKVGFLQLEGITSKDFARLYNTSFTPLIVFVNLNGDIIMRLQGYPGDKVFMSALDYIANDKWKVYDNEKSRIQGFVEYANIDSK